MTQDKARKDAIRQRMAETGEKYNVARRAMEGAEAGPSSSHLISDDETRRIAESFLSSSPWVGDDTWGEIVIGSGAEWLVDFNGKFEVPDELGEGQQWSWSVTFVDPSGQAKELKHEVVLEGLRGLVFGDQDETGLQGIDLLSIRQWFTEPPAERRNLKLKNADCSKICQHALYGRQIFHPDDDRPFGKFDLFSDQRSPRDEE